MSIRTPKISLTSCSSPKRTPSSKSFHSFRSSNSVHSPVHSPTASPKIDIVTSPLNLNGSISSVKDFENCLSDSFLEANTKVVLLTSEVERLKEINAALVAEKDLHASQRYQGELQKELYLKLINSYQEIENLNKIIEDLTHKKSHPDERVQQLLMDLTYWKKKVFELEPHIKDLETKIRILESDKEKLSIECKAKNYELAGIAAKFNAQIKALSNEHDHLRRQLEESNKPKRPLTGEKRDVLKKSDDLRIKAEKHKMIDSAGGLRESRMHVSNSVSNFEVRPLESTRSDSSNHLNKENIKVTSPNSKKISELSEYSVNQKSLKSLSEMKPPRDFTEEVKKENQILKMENSKLSNSIKERTEEMDKLRVKNIQLVQGVFTNSSDSDDRIKYFLDEIENLNNTIVKKSKDNSALAEENKRLQALVGDMQKLKAQNVQLSSEYEQLKTTTAAIIEEIETMKQNIKVNGKPRF